MANCSQCGSAVTDGATFCPVCGTPTTVGEASAASEAAPPAGGFATSAPPPGAGFAAPAGAQPAGGTAMSGFKFNSANLGQLDWIAAAATLVLFISLFLSWYHVSFTCGANFVTGSTTTCSASADALTGHGYMYIVLFVSLILLAAYAARAGFGKLPFTLPISDAQLVLGLSAVNLLFVLIGFFDKSGASWSFGAFIGLLAALVALAPTVVPLAQKQMASR